jgi:hypothetical protein
MTAITAIPTRYGGCHFRSRLEARWAVFFDTLGVRWLYEPQGFEIFGGHYYLPDFHLPDLNVWVEVKGELTRRDAATILNAVDYGGALPGIGNPNAEYPVDPRGLLLLGDIPDVRKGVPVHTLFWHRKGVMATPVSWFGRSLWWTELATTWNRDCWSACGETESREFDSCPRENLLNPGCNVDDYPGVLTSRPREAYTAARSARFEHGTNGVS